MSLWVSIHSAQTYEFGGRFYLLTGPQRKPAEKRQNLNKI